MKWLIGIDEAGRGPLAGPVAVGVFAIHKDQKNKLKVLKKAKDSKVLKEREREEIFKEIQKEQKAGNCMYAVGQSSALYIDTYGIVPAIKDAMKKALKKLRIDPNECEVLLDGSLKAPIEYKNQKTIIKGDAKIPVISAASICAKVTRDRYMKKIAKKKEYGMYELDVHKGYGTLKHRNAIKKYGMSSIHRKSFCRKPLS
jgi:ribonuclease HII